MNHHESRWMPSRWSPHDHRPGRVTPYLEEAIAAAPCARCGGKPSRFQWTICADGNIQRPICLPCDLALQELVLRFMGFSNWKRKMKTYRRQYGTD